MKLHRIFGLEEDAPAVDALAKLMQKDLMVHSLSSIGKRNVGLVNDANMDDTWELTKGALLRNVAKDIKNWRNT